MWKSCHDNQTVPPRQPHFIYGFRISSVLTFPFETVNELEYTTHLCTYLHVYTYSKILEQNTFNLLWKILFVIFSSYQIWLVFNSIYMSFTVSTVLLKLISCVSRSVINTPIRSYNNCNTYIHVKKVRIK